MSTGQEKRLSSEAPVRGKIKRGKRMEEKNITSFIYSHKSKNTVTNYNLEIGLVIIYCAINYIDNIKML